MLVLFHHTFIYWILEITDNSWILLLVCSIDFHRTNRREVTKCEWRRWRAALFFCYLLYFFSSSKRLINLFKHINMQISFLFYFSPYLIIHSVWSGVCKKHGNESSSPRSEEQQIPPLMIFIFFKHFVTTCSE